MNKEQKIAIVCDYSLRPDRVGGMDRFFVAFNELLTKRNHSVDWYFSNVQQFPFYSGLSISAASAKETVEQFFLRESKTKKYDLVITHFLSLCTPFFKTVKQQHGCKIVAVDHNPRPWEGFPMKKRIKNKIKGVVYGRYIDLFIGVSKYTVYHILRDFGFFLQPRTKVIYNGIDTSVFEKRSAPNKGKFIVASHLRESKGIQDLIAAVDLLPEHLLNHLSIDIYGEGPLESFLKKQVTSHSLEDTIVFKGSTDQLPTLFKEYSYLLQPTYMECFSLSILESLSANVPVITTPAGGNLEVIEDGVHGFIHQPGDIRALADILKAIIMENSTITLPVSTIVEKRYTLERMVIDHYNILKCI